MVGILGPNGVGQTIIFQILIGLIWADKGKILIDGEDIGLQPMYRQANFYSRGPQAMALLTDRYADKIRGHLSC